MRQRSTSERFKHTSLPMGARLQLQGTPSTFRNLSRNQVNVQHVYMDKIHSIVPTWLAQVLLGFWMLRRHGWNNAGIATDSHVCYQLHKDHNSYQNMAFWVKKCSTGVLLLFIRILTLWLENLLYFIVCKGTYSSLCTFLSSENKIRLKGPKH